MIEHVYRRASAARHVDRVMVATDDHRIFEAVRAFGGEARMTAGHHVSATDRIGEVAADLDCDLVVNVQGDEPGIDPATIDAAIEPFADDESLQMATVCTRIARAEDLSDPDVVKVVVSRAGLALYFSRAPIPHQRGHLDPGNGPFKHLGLYVYRRAFVLQLAALSPTPLERSESLEQLRVLENGYALRVVESSHDSIGVDTPGDLERVRRQLGAGARV